MGQRLSNRIISRRAIGAADLSCDLSTGSGRRSGRFVSAPAPLPSLPPADRAIDTAPGGDARVRHQSTFVRVLPVRQVPGTLF